MPNRTIVIVTLLLFTTAACSGSGSAGMDAGRDAAVIDASEIDASEIDAPMIDAPEIDAPEIDAPVIDAPIDAPTCPTQPCDLHEQCGCAAPQVCDIDLGDLDGTACRDVTVNGTEGSACNTPTECGAGHVCYGGLCQRYCDADNDCTQPRGQCVKQLENGSTPIAGATTCSSNCNPVSSGASCSVGNKCTFLYADTPPVGSPRDYVDCAPAGSGGQGAACPGVDDTLCAANYLCTQVGTSDSGHCRRNCDLANGNADCAGTGATTCTGFSPSLVIGGITYGSCI